AALDETRNKKGDFAMGGWLAPQDDWRKDFIPAWRDRVLRGQGRIPYLHMAEIWGEEFQDKHGLTGSNAYWCVEEAITLLMNMGSFFPITSSLRDAEFQMLLA